MVDALKKERPALVEQVNSKEVKEVFNSGKGIIFQDTTQRIELKNNPRISVATTPHRTKPMTNGEWFWLDLLLRCSKPKVSQITQAEYAQKTAAQQANLKDVGAFIPGEVGPNRKTRSRYCLTLDLDYATAELWAVFIPLFDVAAFLYSTRKHTPEAARFRLVILLDRPVMEDEHEAVSRWLAGQLGINLFDDTTFQFNRLMYWPSVDKDAQFIFEYQDGSALCVDEVLGKYTNWRDQSEWPYSSRVKKEIHDRKKQQQDPLTKRNFVGTFCRAYTISEAIERFLSKVYFPTADPTRFTYAKGSTFGGLVVYDDKFAYSHHSTDPAGDKLCNAFDLVRYHLTDDDITLIEEGKK
ncbi:MAG TPA: hypothetical protein DHV48_12850 [Prolixibacteraceae bacterium]|nr:hypothetical protein [Prolixibacteraceae bacterium]